MISNVFKSVKLMNVTAWMKIVSSRLCLCFSSHRSVSVYPSLFHSVSLSLVPSLSLSLFISASLSLSVFLYLSVSLYLSSLPPYIHLLCAIIGCNWTYLNIFDTSGNTMEGTIQFIIRTMCVIMCYMLVYYVVQCSHICCSFLNGGSPPLSKDI